MNSVVTSLKSTILAAALASLASAAFLYAAAPAAAAPLAPIGSVAQLSMPRAAGGPIKVGDLCWTETDRSRGFGYYDLCDNNSPYARSRSQFYDERVDGGGGGEGSADGPE